MFIIGLDYKWLWSGLIYVLLVLTTAATVMGCMETLSACVVDEWPSMKPYKPAIVFTFLALLFMINLVMATQGGIYIYYLISVYYTQWPLIFFGLLTVLSAAFSHGGKYLMKDLSDMSKLALNHFINSHLSVLYTTLIPIFLCVSSIFISKKIHENAQLVSTKITWKCLKFFYLQNFSAHSDGVCMILLENILKNLWNITKWICLMNGACL